MEESARLADVREFFCDEEEDSPKLSSRTLAVLREFLEEQNEHQLEHTASGEGALLIPENWRLSQFWYDAITSETIAKEVMFLCDSDSPSSLIACVSCPTLFVHLKKIDSNVPVQLLEYDKRFQQYKDYTFYDYNQPKELPLELKHAFSVVVADPPYLSKECLEKIEQTMSYLARPVDAYFLLLTGQVQKDSVAEILGLRPCRFRPRHTSKLGNEFMLFTNYNPGTRLGGWEVDD